MLNYVIFFVQLFPKDQCKMYVISRMVLIFITLNLTKREKNIKTNMNAIHIYAVILNIRRT